MISFITYNNLPEQIEIVLDNQGIDELISYLEEIRKTKDHFHLTIDTELNKYPIAKRMKGKTINVKSVRLEFAETSTWDDLNT